MDYQKTAYFGKMMRTWGVIIGLCAAIAGILIFLEITPLPYDTLLWREIYNTGHIPLFGLLSLVLLALSRKLFGRNLSNQWHYWGAGITGVILGAMSEIIQIGGHRNADFYDFLRDLVGILCTLMFLWSFDKNVSKVLFIAKSKRIVQLLRIGALSLIFIMLFPLIFISFSYGHRNQIFPALFNFESMWESKYVFADSAQFTFVQPPLEWEKTGGKTSLKVTYQASPYTSITIQDLYPNWTGYDYFTFDTYSENSAGMKVGLRIVDRYYQRRADDRFGQIITIPGGASTFRIPLSDIARGPKGRLLDLREVKRVVFYSAEVPRKVFTLYFDNFRVE